MSVGDKKGTTQGNIPRWEAELWSHVSGGDGMRCPLYETTAKSERGVAGVLMSIEST